MKHIPKIDRLGALALALLLFLTMPALAKDIRGTLINVYGEYQQFALVDEDLSERSFRLAEDGKVFINEEEAHLSDLQVGDEVAVVYEIRNYEMVATSVRCTRGP